MSTAAGLRVVQWATGNIGTRSLRALIEHPGLELAGVYVHSEAKVGKDAGELCGVDPVGVTATDDIDQIIALGADCVLYMQQWCNFDDIARLLGAGCNIVTTRVEFHHPEMLDPAVREQIESACRLGQSSIYSTGSSPGFITEAVPLVLTSIQRRLDCLTIDEFADLSRRDSPDLLFNIMGYGKPPSEFGEEQLAHIKAGFTASLRQLAEAIRMPLDGFEVSGEVATTRTATAISAGELAKGTVGAQRITVSGMRNGRPLLRIRMNWYCTRDIEPGWELGDTGWRIQVEGDAPLDVTLRMPVPLDAFAATMPGYTAHRAVNAVAVVCGAAPGIRTTVDLPQVIADLG
jgi:2,4-diaminopentanoate dehydrogenase